MRVDTFVTPHCRFACSSGVPEILTVSTADTEVYGHAKYLVGSVKSYPEKLPLRDGQEDDPVDCSVYFGW